MKRLKTIIKENTTLKDKELTIWEEHPNYTKKFDEIKSFCQSNSFSEEDAWEMMDSFEKKDFVKTQDLIIERKQEIKDLLKTINYVYYYLDKLKNKSEALDVDSEQS